MEDESEQNNGIQDLKKSEGRLVIEFVSQWLRLPLLQSGCYGAARGQQWGVYLRALAYKVHSANAWTMAVGADPSDSRLFANPAVQFINPPKRRENRCWGAESAKVELALAASLRLP